MKRQVDLETNIDGDPKGFTSAARAAQAEAKKLERENAKLERRLKTMGAQMDKSGKSATLMRGELATLVAGGAAVAPAFVAAGAGIGAFGALAVPTIMRVVKAQTEMADTWDSLSRGEKISAAGLRQLVGQYKDLAKSVEPEVLGTFNAGLNLMGDLLPHLAPLTRAVAKELRTFVSQADDALNSDRAKQFFTFLESEAGPATAAVGDALGSTAHLAVSLTESLAPLATSGLGLVSMFLKLVAAISDVSPELAQLAVLGIGLRGPIGAAGGLIGKFTGEAKGASLATRALNLVTKAGPNLYVAAGLAIAFFGVKALTAKSSTDKLVDSLRVANRATGNNVTGYQALAGSLQNRLNASLVESTKQFQQHGEALRIAGGRVPVYNREALRLSQEQTDLRDAISLTNEQIADINDGAGALAKKYGLTREQALRLADAVGVDLSKGILDAGEITASTAAKFDRYRQAVELASNPTAVISEAWKDAANSGLGLKERVDALSSALDAFFNPSIAVFNATTQLKEAFVRAQSAIDKSKGSLDTHNAASRAARDAFADATSKVAATANAIYVFTSKTKGAEAAVAAQRAAVLRQLPELARLAGGNRDAQAQVAGLAYSFGISGKQARDAGVKVQGLINKINALQSKSITLTTKMITRYIKQGKIGSASALAGVQLGGGQASGGLIRGPGSGTSDSIPARLSNGEYVVNAAATARHRDLLEAINAKRYAQGGLVGGNVAVPGFAAGGMVNVPISEFIDRYVGTPATKQDVTTAINRRKDAVEQLRKAERKLADDRRHHRSGRTIADDEARVAKERRDLTSATSKLTTVEARYAKARQTPIQKLGAGLALGIKNTAAFLKNIQTIANRGYIELAQQLLAMGGPDAEKYAAAAAKLSKGKIAALNKQVITASKQQSQLAALPNILAVKAARKQGITDLPGIMRVTGLSEDEVSAAMTGMGFARGGLVRGPGSGTSDSIRARLSRGEYVVRAPAVARHLPVLDAINTGRALPAAGGAARVVIDVTGGNDEFLRWLRGRVRVVGGGNVQVALGQGR